MSDTKTENKGIKFLCAKKQKTKIFLFHLCALTQFVVPAVLKKYLPTKESLRTSKTMSPFNSFTPVSA